MKEALKVNTKLNDEGMYTWYTHALKIFEELDLEITEYENFDKPFLKVKKNLKCKIKKVVEDIYKNQLMSKISNLTSGSKLYLYIDKN